MLGLRIISETLVVYVAAALSVVFVEKAKQRLVRFHLCEWICEVGLPVALGQSDHQSCPLPGIGWRSINSLLLFKSLSLLLLGQESSTFSVNKGFVYNSLSEQYKNIARSLSCIIIKV